MVPLHLFPLPARSASSEIPPRPSAISPHQWACARAARILAGPSSRSRVRYVEPLACLVVCLAATPAVAQTASFNIPAGRLSDALIALGRQAGLTVGAS